MLPATPERGHFVHWLSYFCEQITKKIKTNPNHKGTNVLSHWLPGICAPLYGKALPFPLQFFLNLYLSSFCEQTWESCRVLRAMLTVNTQRNRTMCSSPERHEITISVCETVRRGENRVGSPWVRREICRYQDNMPLKTFCSREEKRASTITTAAAAYSVSHTPPIHKHILRPCTSFCVCVCIFQHS